MQPLGLWNPCMKNLLLVYSYCFLFFVRGSCIVKFCWEWRGHGFSLNCLSSVHFSEIFNSVQGHFTLPRKTSLNNIKSNCVVASDHRTLSFLFSVSVTLFLSCSSCLHTSTEFTESLSQWEQDCSSCTLHNNMRLKLFRFQGRISLLWNPAHHSLCV